MRVDSCDPLNMLFKTVFTLKDSYTEDDCWETGFHICVSSESALPPVELCFLCGSAGEGKVCYTFSLFCGKWETYRDYLIQATAYDFYLRVVKD